MREVGGGVTDQGGRKDIFYLNREGKIREKVVFLINNLANWQNHLALV